MIQQVQLAQREGGAEVPPMRQVAVGLMLGGLG